MNKKWTISFLVSDTLTTEEIWPEGDAPVDPTVQDVYDVLRLSGDPICVARDWNLTPTAWDVREE